jgi:outer membrane usher protein FimD/PapC
VDVKDADGKPVTWMVEAGSPNVLLRRGFTKATIPAGTPVVVEGYQSKDGSMRANGRDISLPNGQKLFLGSQGTGAPYEATKDEKKDDKK